MGQPTVILGSVEVASELLDTRGIVTTRSHQSKTHQLPSRDDLLGSTNHSDGWRAVSEPGAVIPPLNC